MDQSTENIDLKQPDSVDSSDNRKTTVEKFIVRFHFVFLYVMLYSTFRNTLWFVDDLTEAETIVLKFLIIGFFIWFIVANLFLYMMNYKRGWNRKDYLSRYVLSSTVIILIILEILVFQ